jgi:tetratricopeptide (TPR) repeat protein
LALTVLLLFSRGEAAPAAPETAPATRIFFQNTAINGQPAQLAMDTGADGACLVESSAKRLGIKVAPLSAAVVAAQPGEAFSGLTDPVSITLDAQSFSMALQTINPPTAMYSGHEDGIIGWPAVRENILVFDSDRRMVNSVENLPAEASGWLKLKIWPGRVLLLEITMANGTLGTIMVDTGFPGGVALPPEQWKEWKEAHPNAPSITRTDYVVSGGVYTAEEAWADEIKLGPLTLTDVPVREANATELAVSDNFAGSIGMYALERLNSVIDGKNGWAYLNPKPPPGPPYPGIERPGSPSAKPQSDTDWTVADKVNLNGDNLLAQSYTVNGSSEQGKGDYDGALADFNRAIELDPKNYGAYLLRGQVKTNQGDYDGAIADFNQAFALNPSDGAVYGNRGAAKVMKGDLDGATSDLNQALALDPKNSDAYVILGKTKVLKGDLDGGMADLNQALTLDPKNAQAYENRGAAKVIKGDLDGGIVDLNQALALDPKNAQAYENRGEAKGLKGDLDGGLGDLNQALALDPKNTHAYESRAKIRGKKGDFDGVIADMTQVIMLNPKNAIAYALRGAAKGEKRDLVGAINDLTQALSLDPKNAPAYESRGMMWLMSGNLDGGIADLTQALALDTKDVNAYNIRGQAREMKGDLDGAIADYTQSLELDPKNTMVYFKRGMDKIDKGDSDGAIADFTAALALDPKNHDAYHVRGSAKRGIRDYDGAIADYTAALSLDPQNYDDYNDRGAAKAEKNDSDGAIADFDKAIELKPDDSDYAQLYREVLRLQAGKAPADFATAVAGWKDGWPKTIGQFLSGKIDEPTLLAAAEKTGDEPVSGQQCEAYYYIGVMRLCKDDRIGARDFFQKCVATGMKDYDEYEFAGIKLAQLSSAGTAGIK